MNPISIDIEKLSFHYDGNHEILKNISFHACNDESIGLVGANGVGKSTLLKLIVGLNLNFAGKIMVNNIPVKKDTLPQIREKIGYVFQDSDTQLFMSTAFEDIAFAPRNYGISEAEVVKRVDNALQMVGAAHLRNRHTFKMSGGEKKLISIATILSMTPDIILMDEPSVALDPRNRRNLIHILNSLSLTKIIASHDLDFILDTCERTILLADGQIICDGPTRELLANQALLEKNGLELPLSMSHRV